MKSWNVLKEGRSGKCFLLNNIVKKVYTNKQFQRMSNEINALKILDKYQCFPKLLKIDWDNYTIYMSYVGKSIKESKKYEIPKNIISQIMTIEAILKKENIHHNDLSLSHLMIYNGIVYLIDFEKVFINRKDTPKSYRLSSFKNIYLSDIIIDLKKYLSVKFSVPI